MTPPEDNKVQCAGQCRGWVDAADLDDLGLCEPCGDSYYGVDLQCLDDEFGGGEDDRVESW